MSQLIFASVRLLMIRQRRTLEGEIIPHQIYDMEITHLRNGQLFFPRPNVIEHAIDSRSPLFGIQRDTLSQSQFEIIAILEGSFDYTGFPCHFRTSYLPRELLWGYQFSTCHSTLSGFDYQKFNEVQLIDASPIWNYEEDDPTTPPGSPYSPRREFQFNRTTNENLHPTKLLPCLETIASVPSDLTTLDFQDKDEKRVDADVLPIIKVDQFE